MYKCPTLIFKYFINSHFKKVWQEEWDTEVENKLHSIHPALGLWPKATRISRREEVVLARIRLGHTHLTHAYLLKGEDRPECIPCACPLTVKHVLLDCDDFSHVRRNYYEENDMKDLFEKVDPTLILEFLREIGLFYRL